MAPFVDPPETVSVVAEPYVPVVDVSVSAVWSALAKVTVVADDDTGL